MRIANFLLGRHSPPFLPRQPQPSNPSFDRLQKFWNEYRNQLPWGIFLIGGSVLASLAANLGEGHAIEHVKDPSLVKGGQKVDRVGRAAISLVVDESGSMSSVQNETVASVKEFIHSQTVYPDTSVTIVKFNDRVHTVIDTQPIHTVNPNSFASQYSPKGSTALNDAIGKTIISQSEKIEKMNPSERPEHVIIAIVTDGQENSSVEFSQAQIKQMIEEKQKLGWTIIFLSADESLDIDQVTKSYGIPPGLCAAFAAASIGVALGVVASMMANKRTGQEVIISDAQRKTMKPQGSNLGRHRSPPSFLKSTTPAKPSHTPTPPPAKPSPTPAKTSSSTPSRARGRGK